MSIIYLYKNNQLFFLNLFFIILALRIKLHDATRSVYLKLEHKSITKLSRGSPKTSKNQIVSSKNRPIKKETDSRNLNVHSSLQTTTINLEQKRKLVLEFKGPSLIFYQTTENESLLLALQNHCIKGPNKRCAHFGLRK